MDVQTQRLRRGRIAETSKPDWAKALRYAGGILLVLALVAYKSDLRNAAFVTACFVVGYLNIFSALRGVIAVFTHQKIGLGAVSLIALALLGDVILIYAGYGLVLGLATASCLIIDAAVLRFR
jgi:hypothetical protein